MQRPIVSDELNIFYNSVGEAVWQIQYLEHAIVNFVVIKRHKRKPSSVKEAHERLETERKGTLGSLYGRAKDEPVLFMRALKVTHFRQLDDPLTVFGLEGTIFGSVFTLSA